MYLMTNRLSLRKFTLSDLKSLHQIMANEKIALMAGFKKRTSLLETEKTLNIFIHEPLNSLWAISLNKNLIGWIELHQSLEIKDSYEIGIVLNEDCWGRGFAVEAINFISTYALTSLNINSLVVSHFKENLQSKKAIEKCNFKFLGIFNDKSFYIKLKS